MKPFVHALTRLAIPCAIVLTAGCTQGVHAEEYTKSYSVTGRANVHVHTDDGNVRVITSDTLQVEFHVRSEGSDWGLEVGEPPRIESHQNGDQVELTARIHSKVLFGVSRKKLSIEVHMPRNADLQLETGDGNIDVSSLNGTVAVHTGDGGIKASQLAGPIDLDTGDGDITVDNLKGTLKLHTGDGTINAAKLDGSCAASSGDGSIHVAGRFDALDIRTGDGDLAASVEPGSQISSNWSIRTGDGGITVALPKDFKANLDASTGDGDVTLDLPVSVQGDVGKQRVHGILNGGGPSVSIHTGDGSIHIKGI